MGQPKLALPWGGTTVIGQVVRTLLDAGVSPVIVVTGGARQAVESALRGLDVSFAHNPHFESGEMLATLQAGLGEMPAAVQSVLVVLGDQPQIEAQTIHVLLAAAADAPKAVWIPSFQMRRGHPWYLPRGLWAGLLALRPPATLRDFLNQAGALHYAPVDSASILADLDTPEEYARQRPS
jgi:molybdenum cofactor cytidylyltransferase